MNENIFFDLAQLKHLGQNVIIGKTVRVRYPELVEIGDNVIVDDFTYISTGLKIEGNVHISSGCKLIGGRNSSIRFREYSTLAPNVVLAAGSDDYVSGIATPMVSIGFKGNVEIGYIKIGRHCIVGANTTILPNVELQDGAAVGAQSLVKNDLSAWSLYAGVPARKIKDRNQDEIKKLEKQWNDRENE